MKNRNQIFYVFLLISIYCFGISAPLNSVEGDSLHNLAQAGQQKELLKSDSQNSIFLVQTSKNLLSGLAEAPLQINNLTYFEFWAVLFLLLVLLVNSWFVQYIRYLYSILNKQQEAVLIFPFHSFW